MEQDRKTDVYKETSREVVLDFSVDAVFAAFERVVQASDGKFSIENKNAAFNTFTVFMRMPLFLASGHFLLRVKLERLDEKKTKLTGVSDVPEEIKEVSDDYIDKFLVIVGRGLEGAEFTEDEVNRLRSGKLGSGCLSAAAVFCFLLLLAVLGRYSFAG